jgi:transposase InsO family protein
MTQGMKPKNPGELFQIDHMTVSLASDFTVKHFQGVCPVTKMVVEQAYSRATSTVAKQFLEFVLKSLPFKIKSIQVDGGSEFMKDFEQACKELDILLYVLPPRSPEYNGVVERVNGSPNQYYSRILEDFLTCTELGQIIA